MSTIVVELVISEKTTAVLHWTKIARNEVLQAISQFFCLTNASSKSSGRKKHTEETVVFIDSGATCNIVNRTSWENLRKRGVKCESCNCQEKLFAYGKTKPIEGKFQSEIYREESRGISCMDVGCEFVCVFFKVKEKLFLERSLIRN